MSGLNVESAGPAVACLYSPYSFNFSNGPGFRSPRCFYTYTYTYSMDVDFQFNAYNAIPTCASVNSASVAKNRDDWSRGRAKEKRRRRMRAIAS